MKILITGGSGMIGQKLTEKLLANNHEVAWLSRSKSSQAIQTFVWDIQSKTIDAEALQWADAVVHLAGASVAGKRWTEEYKKVIYDSRIDSSKLLVEAIRNAAAPPSILVSASAIGYYGGFKTKNKALEESASSGDDFLAKVTEDWEKEVFEASPAVRTVALRIGIVLADNEGGALQKMAIPVRYFVGAPLASGEQMMSWIHLDDLVEMFVFAIENNALSGVYNAVAPNPVSNKEMTVAIAKQLQKPLLLPNVPTFALKILLGEFASFVVEGVNVSSKKIEDANFQFQFPTLDKALSALL